MFAWGYAVMDIYGVIHVGNIGRWRSIFDDQVARLEGSGLLSKTKKVFIGTSGSKIDTDLWPGEIVVENPNLEDGEVETLRKLHDICQNIPPSKVWYIHTKGASIVPNSSTDHHGENTPSVIKFTDSWREYMEYFIIDRHEDCISALDRHDVCGVEYRQKRKPHFAGNFWWSTSIHIKKLKGFMTSQEPGYSGRYAAETGFVTMGDPIVKNFFSINRDLYLDGVHPVEYLPTML